MNKLIAIIDHRPFREATRSKKEVKSLAKHYFTTWIGLNDVNRFQIENAAPREKYIKIPNCSSHSTRFGKFLLYPRLNIKIYKLLKIIGPCVIHLHDLKLMYGALTYSILNKIDILYDAHELHFSKRVNSNVIDKTLNNVDYLLEKILINKTTYNIHCSHERAAIFSNRHKNKFAHVIENHELFRNVDKNAENIRDRIQSKGLLVVFTGHVSLNSVYNHYKVIESISLFPGDINYCLVGFFSDSTKEAISDYAKKLGCSDKICFIKAVPVNDLVNFISSADMCIIPLEGVSLNHRYPALNKLSQSLMAGLPIVYNKLESLDKICISNPIGKVGYSFDSSSSMSIVKAISNCINDKYELRRNALRLAKLHMNWETQEDKLYCLYKNIVNNKLLPVI